MHSFTHFVLTVCALTATTLFQPTSAQVNPLSLTKEECIGTNMTRIRWCEPTQKCIGPVETCPEQPAPPGPGSDVDIHGCRRSWGQKWCALLNRCANVGETCPAAPGSDVDEFGCKASAGQTWCVSAEKCLRAWEPCSEDLGGDDEETECKATEGKQWCANAKKCLAATEVCPAGNDASSFVPYGVAALSVWMVAVAFADAL